MQKYRVFSVCQRFAYPMTIYGFALAAFVTLPLSGSFFGYKDMQPDSVIHHSFTPLAASGGAMSVTGGVPTVVSIVFNAYIPNRDNSQNLLITANPLGRMQRLSRSSQVICRCSQQNGAAESNRLAVQKEHTTFAHDNRSAV